jgi:preprotein translocase subunit YajC
MLSKVERGSEVIAASGILGKVTDVKGDYVSIEVGQNITLRLQKSAISNILPKGTIDSIK